jgi:hypothetical protein
MGVSFRPPRHLRYRFFLGPAIPVVLARSSAASKLATVVLSIGSTIFGNKHSVHCREGSCHHGKSLSAPESPAESFKLRTGSTISGISSIISGFSKIFAPIDEGRTKRLRHRRLRFLGHPATGQKKPQLQRPFPSAFFFQMPGSSL